MTPVASLSILGGPWKDCQRTSGGPGFPSHKLMLLGRVALRSGFPTRILSPRQRLFLPRAAGIDRTNPGAQESSAPPAPPQPEKPTPKAVGPGEKTGVRVGVNSGRWTRARHLPCGRVTFKSGRSRPGRPTPFHYLGPPGVLSGGPFSSRFKAQFKNDKTGTDMGSVAGRGFLTILFSPGYLPGLGVRVSTWRAPGPRRSLRPPQPCADLVAECRCDASGQDCRWEWVSSSSDPPRKPALACTRQQVNPPFYPKSVCNCERPQSRLCPAKGTPT